MRPGRERNLNGAHCAGVSGGGVMSMCASLCVLDLFSLIRSSERWCVWVITSVCL